MPVTTPLGLIVGLAGGLASAVLFYSAVRGSPTLSILLLLLSPLPTLIAAIGWGMAAVTVAALACAIVMAAAVSVPSAIGSLISLGLPALGISYLAFLSRAIKGDADVREWYPPGRLVAAIAFYGGALPLIIVTLSGVSFEDLREPLAEALRRFSRDASLDLGLQPLSDAQLKAATDLLIVLLPGFIAGYWTAIFSVNTYVAARVARASGHLARPWPDLPSMRLPKDALVVLAIALLAAFATGLVSVAGVSLIGSLMFAFFLAGLALVHAIARRRTPAILIATYAALVLAGPYTAAILVLCGATDTLFDIKGRLGPRPAT
ncbi:MAG: DUF2232 domain-containing protein [Hyphomicrobiaceae bacterium]|nr:DUF2232 domain-containing protein [Hyphomicrobiaceae bacterium]